MNEVKNATQESVSQTTENEAVYAPRVDIR